MKKETRLKKIFEELKQVQSPNDDCTIFKNSDHVYVEIGKTNIIYGYMLRSISQLTEKFCLNWYVTTDLDNKVFVSIYSV